MSAARSDVYRGIIESSRQSIGFIQNAKDALISILTRLSWRTAGPTFRERQWRLSLSGFHIRETHLGIIKIIGKTMHGCNVKFDEMRRRPTRWLPERVSCDTRRL